MPTHLIPENLRWILLVVFLAQNSIVITSATGEEEHQALRENLELLHADQNIDGWTKQLEKNSKKGSDGTSGLWDLENAHSFNPIGMQKVTIEFDENISISVLQSTSAFCETGADDTGLVVWGPSVALSQYLIREADWINGQRVLELGCGSALPSMVATRLGASEVMATDFRLQTLDQVRYHSQENLSRLAVGQMDWNNHESLPVDFQADILLAADVIYGVALVPPLVQTIRRLLPHNGWLLVATRDGRQGIPEFRQLMKSDFKEEILRQGLDHSYLPDIPDAFADDPISLGTWMGNHSIYKYQWREKD